MKNLIRICLIFFVLNSCSKDDDRQKGVCYCEFFSGDDQEYDLSNLSRQDQIDQCNTHDSNAANFGGHCELE